MQFAPPTLTPPGGFKAPNLDLSSTQDFFNNALKKVQNTLLDMEGSEEYVGGSGNINRNLMHNILRVSDSELRERGLRDQFNSPENAALRQKYGGKFGAFKKDLGTKGTIAITEANEALTNPKGAVRQLTLLGKGDLAEGVNLFDQSSRDELTGVASEALKAQKIADNAAEIEGDPNFIRQGQQIKRDNIQQDWNNQLAASSQNLQLMQHKDNINQQNLEREWRNKESQREWDYRRKRDREDNLDDLFKIIMGGINSFI